MARTILSDNPIFRKVIFIDLLCDFYTLLLILRLDSYTIAMELI